MAEKLRKAYINIILKENEDIALGRDFLETLSLEELRNLSVEALAEADLEDSF